MSEKTDKASRDWRWTIVWVVLGTVLGTQLVSPVISIFLDFDSNPALLEAFVEWQDVILAVILITTSAVLIWLFSFIYLNVKREREAEAEPEAEGAVSEQEQRIAYLEQEVARLKKSGEENTHQKNGGQGG